MDITTIPLFLFIYRVQGRALETNVRITDKHLVGPFVWLSYGLLYSMAIPGSDLLEVPIPYILGLFFRPKFQGISPENMAQNMVLRTSILGSWVIPIGLMEISYGDILQKNGDRTAATQLKIPIGYDH